MIYRGRALASGWLHFVLVLFRFRMLSYAMKADSAGKSQTRLFTRTLLEKVSSHSLIEHFVALTRQLDLRHTKDGISSLLDPKESKLLKKRRESSPEEKSRVKWICDGDRNTRFSHLSTMVRRNQNRVVGLEIDGAWVTDVVLAVLTSMVYRNQRM